VLKLLCGLVHLISVWIEMPAIGVICAVSTTFALRLADKDRRSAQT